MAIALDNAVAGGTATTTSPLTWSHTVTSSGTGQFLVVVTGITDNASLTTATVTGVTYAGVAMTLAKRQRANNGVNTSLEVCIWMLANPATGANTVSVAFTADSIQSETTGGSISYTGAQGTSTPDSSNSTTGTSTGAQTVSTTVVASNCWIVNAVGQYSSNTLTASQTSRFNISLSTFAQIGGEDTNGTVGTGAQSTGWTIGSGASYWTMAAASFAPLIPPDAVVISSTSIRIVGP